MKQVIHVLTPSGKTLYHRQNQFQIAIDQLLPGHPVSLLDSVQQI